MLNASAEKEYLGDFEDFFDRLEDPRCARGEEVAGVLGVVNATGAMRGLVGWGGKQKGSGWGWWGCFGERRGLVEDPAFRLS